MASTGRILIVYAHPEGYRSRVNRKLVEAARTLPEVHVQDLYETYPDFFINATRERALINQSELLVFLHPLRWYGMPSLMKEWFDVVLEPNWASGKNLGCVLGKGYMLVITTASPADAFGPDGEHGRPLSDFLAPFEQIAARCGMRWMAPHVLHNAKQADDRTLDSHVEAFRHRLEAWLAGATPLSLPPAAPIDTKTGHGI
jgi:glutathione-regulated potassium-efflux system ancillary protein KefF